MLNEYTQCHFLRAAVFKNHNPGLASSAKCLEQGQEPEQEQGQEGLVALFKNHSHPCAMMLGVL